jgi:hypothetical protein
MAWAIQAPHLAVLTAYGATAALTVLLAFLEGCRAIFIVDKKQAHCTMPDQSHIARAARCDARDAMRQQH